MDTLEKNKILKQILWDYNISPDEADAVLKGEKQSAGHYTRENLFLKLLESYSWYTIIQLISPKVIKSLLTKQLISKLRSPALRNKYEFVRERLQQIIPTSG